MGQSSSVNLVQQSNLNELIDTESGIRFTINKVKYTVPKYIRAETSLNYFIRNIAKLKGTKYMCQEGGCGVCIVAAKINDQVVSVNSCQVPIFLCNSWDIITIEGIGGKLQNYNILQKTLAEMNGSQCGYCSPAMIMNMYSLIFRGKTDAKDIENSFGSNICQCTGYRSILDAFQLFANDIPKSLSSVYDIEDVYKSVLCLRNCVTCEDEYKDFEIIDDEEPKLIYLKLKDADFFKLYSVSQIFGIFKNFPDASYILNGGNTGNGVVRMSKKELYIDINGVTELQRIQKNATTLTIGGGVTLEKVKECFQKYSDETGFEYLQQLADHVEIIGHVSMRNIGTIAGNLMLKHQHREFVSDLFVILEAAGAEVHILKSEGSKIESNFLRFLEIDMEHKLIYSIVLTQQKPDSVYKSYKVMPRSQNSHAHVNAGFLFRLDKQHRVLAKPNLIFDGINPKFLHASKTEEFLKDKRLFDKETVKEALSILKSELKPDHVLPEPTPEYRRKLAMSLFYKFILSLKPSNLDERLESGGTILERGISSGKTDYDADKSTWPVNKPVQKIEALYQTSGEAEYVNDIPERHDEVFCVFAMAEEPGPIKNIDASDALNLDGVVAFYTAKDVPGKNVSIDKTAFFTYADEPLFAEKEITYAGQPYGMIVATSQYEAYNAITKVKLLYEDGPRKRPLITIQDVLASNDKSRVQQSIKIPPTEPPGKDVKHTIKGNFKSGSQYHYTLEPHCCICIPLEDELEVFVTTQFITFIQRNIATCLGIPENWVNIKVRRLGGAYGAKISRTSQVATACAVAAYNLKRPARMNLNIEEMMKTMGKRASIYEEYELGVNDSGKIQYLKSEYWINQGFSFNDSRNIFVIDMIKNCYEASTWNLTATNVQTDLPCNTWCRAPGSAEGLAIIENIMEHIARVTKNDSVQVRIENLKSEYKDVVKSMVDEIIKTSDYENRRKEIDSFNKKNRWKKRGIGISLMRFQLDFNLSFYSMVSIYSRDGTVAICHGGIEMGQGVNTKVAQVAAHILGIDMKKIRIKPTNNLTSPNSRSSGSNATSDCCASATKVACEELVRRLQPIKEKLTNPTWEQITNAAAAQGVDLCAIHQYNKATDLPQSYGIYGVTVTEIELDVLTGQHIVQRVDILEDTGVSLNPEIDVGQIQGAFIMGQGLWTTEELHYDPRTGALTNYRTWNYKPPGAKDIPVDFRVNLLRNAPNPNGILRSKATGEPALCMSFAIPIAIRYALDSARADAGNNDVWYNLDGPVTAEKIMLTGATEIEHLTL